MRYKKCVKCGQIFPMWKMIGGKRRSFTQRKYCLECSPFGDRNTRSLERARSPTKCQKCGREKLDQRKLCSVCAVSKHRKTRMNLLHSIVGLSCWICGYGGDRRHIPLLNMHHVNPATKAFELSGRGMQREWNSVVTEMQKCVLACIRCHREAHHDLLDVATMEKIRVREWKTRRRVAPNGKGPVC